METKQCPECGGTGKDKIIRNLECYVCEGSGFIAASPTSHCAACGEPVETGLNWCQFHKPASDLYQALQDLEEAGKAIYRFPWRSEEEEVVSDESGDNCDPCPRCDCRGEVDEECPICGGTGYV